jgi:hypothetical protein
MGDSSVEQLEKLKALCAKQQAALKAQQEKLTTAGQSQHSDDEYAKLKKMVSDALDVPSYFARTCMFSANISTPRESCDRVSRT